MMLSEGDDFYVNDLRFVVTEIVSPVAFKIRRESDGQLFVMEDDGRVQGIAPLTSAFVGTRGTKNQARVAVNAPKSVFIDPGVNYRAKGGHTRT